MPTYLDSIIARHRELARLDTRATSDLWSRALEMGPCKGFREALRSDGLSIIAEIKRRSPSKGELNSALDPVAQSVSYEGHGASCISVLTDGEHFGGSLEDLREVRASVALPILRKDFTVSANDILDAKLNGADAVLLIVSALSKSELEEFFGVAREAGLDALIEIHDEDELEVAKGIGADLVGVNQRDLFTFDVDADRALAMVGSFEGRMVKVCESGISSVAQIRKLANAGYDAALIGEALVRSKEPGRMLSEFILAGRNES